MFGIAPRRAYVSPSLARRRRRRPLVIACIAAAAILSTAPREMFGPAHADVPVENISFFDKRLEEKAKKIGTLVNDCDSLDAGRGIAELEEIVKTLGRSFAGAGLPPQDLLKLPDLIKLLKVEFAARCGPNVFEFGFDLGLRRSYGFFVPAVRDYAKQQLDAVKACADVDETVKTLRAQEENIKSQAQQRTPQQGRAQLEADARSLGQAANWLAKNKAAIEAYKAAIRSAAPQTPGVAPGGTPAGTDTPAPGATPTGPTPPGPGRPVTPPRPGTPEFGYFQPTPGINPNVLWGDYFYVEPNQSFAQGRTVFNVAAGPNVAGSERPQTEFGTFFNPATAREELIGRTRGRYTGAGGSVEVDVVDDDWEIMRWIQSRGLAVRGPARAEQYADRSATELAQLRAAPVARLAGRWRFGAKIDWYRYSGSQDVAVTPGTFNVAHTFIAPNPATGTTGILLGATGDAIAVKSHGDQVNAVANLIFTQPLPGPFGAGEIWYWSLGAGARLGIRWDSHEIMQQSMTFSGIAMTTDLSTSEVFAGPNLVAGAGIDRGDIFGAINAYVAPGALFISGKAKQTSLCNLCPLAGDRNIAQELNFDTTKFVVKVGVEVKGGYRFTRNFAIEGAFGFHHTSHTGAIHNPITPNQQPAALFTATTNTIVGSIRAVVRW